MLPYVFWILYCVFERYCFHRWDIYAAIYHLIHRTESLFPELPCYSGWGFSTGTSLCGGIQKRNWQYNPRMSRPPNCISGWHGCSWQKFLYWQHHTNSAFSLWYKPSPTYMSSDTNDDDGSNEPPAPPWWYFLRGYFCSLQMLILSGCHTHLHFKWWCWLRHRLSDFLVSFCVIYHRVHCLLTKQTVASAFGFKDELYSIYSTDLWRRAPFLGDDSFWVLAASAKTRSVDCQKPSHPSTVSFLPSSFNVPSSQQIWPCVRCPNYSRSEGDFKGGSKLKAHLNKWSGQLSMFTMIIDRGANLNLFNNRALLEWLTISPFNKKSIRGVNGQSKFYQKGSLNRDLGDLLLPKNDYYYSPYNMANILSLALISKTNRVYMGTAIDNAFYVFDGKGKYLRFHLCHITSL